MESTTEGLYLFAFVAAVASFFIPSPPSFLPRLVIGRRWSGESPGRWLSAMCATGFLLSIANNMLLAAGLSVFAALAGVAGSFMFLRFVGGLAVFFWSPAPSSDAATAQTVSPEAKTAIGCKIANWSAILIWLPAITAVTMLSAGPSAGELWTTKLLFAATLLLLPLGITGLVASRRFPRAGQVGWVMFGLSFLLAALF